MVWIVSQNDWGMNTPAKAAIVVALLITATLMAKWEPFNLGEQRTNPATFGDAQHIGAVACSEDGKVVYVCQTNLLWKSSDGGETWVMLKTK